MELIKLLPELAPSGLVCRQIQFPQLIGLVQYD